MRKTVVVLATKGKKGYKETNKFIENIMNIWESYEVGGKAFPSFFIFPYRKRKIRTEICMARYKIIKSNDQILIV
jgi:hypothetical protein